MARRLNTYVHAVQRDEDGNTLQSAVFGPADDLPDWAVEAITNPDVWADEPATEPDKPARSRSRSR